jgi:hypothetical protein
VFSHLWRNLKQTELGANLEYEMSLPFLPFPGLVVRDKKVAFIVERVMWDASQNCFSINAQDEKLTGVGHDHCTFEELAEELRKDGWAVTILDAGKYVE